MRGAVRSIALALTVLAPLVARADEPPVRAADHGDYGRIALDFPSPVAFEANVAGRRLVVRFAAPLGNNPGILARELPAYVASARLENHGKTLVAVLKRTVSAHAFTVSDRTVVIDLTPASEKKAAPTNKTAREPAKKFKPAAAKSLAEKLNRIAPAAAPAATPAPAAASPAPASADTAAADAEPAPPPPPATVAVHLLPVDGGAGLRFDWPVATDAAVFGDGGSTFIVFSTPTALDLSEPLAKAQQSFAELTQLAAKNATVLRVVATNGLAPGVRRAGSAWIVDFKPQAATVDAPIAFEADPTGTPAKVVIHVAAADKPVRIADGDFGDLLVLPVGELGRGVSAPPSFVDFRVLPSALGIVLHPTVPDLAFYAQNGTVEVTRPGGLELSGDRDRLLGNRPAEASRLFDFPDWVGPKGVDYFDRRAFLERAIILAPVSARTEPRLALAHFFFAHLFAAETLAVLDTIGRDDPAALNQPEVEALKGAACLLADDLECAANELGQPSLDGQAEVALWRASLASAQGNEAAAATGFADSVSLLPTYPKALRERFALEAADAMIETGRTALAEPLIDLVRSDHPPVPEAAMAAYLEGRFQQQAGRLDDALQSWQKAAAFNDPPSRARALYASALALLKAGKKSPAETIDTLDGLRFAWRGGRFEFELLRKLGELELADNREDRGLEALHQAVVDFPDEPATKDITKEAGDAFAALFLGQHGDDLPPLKALAMYDQFHDLEPAGDRRDQIVKKLIDRLVSVDLLDRAADLLDEQVTTRLSGEDKARGATQLAVLRLMNHQPDDALKVLDLDVGYDIPADLARQRKQLRARVLTELGRSPEALALINGDESRDADRLRADIYWRTHDWKDAASVLARLIGAPPATGKIDEDDARLVVSLAAALTLDDDKESLAHLGATFGPALAASPYADAFAVLAGTSGAAKTAADPLALASQVAQLGELKSFMAAYKDAAPGAAKAPAVN